MRKLKHRLINLLKVTQPPGDGVVLGAWVIWLQSKVRPKTSRAKGH